MVLRAFQIRPPLLQINIFPQQPDKFPQLKLFIIDNATQIFLAKENITWQGGLSSAKVRFANRWQLPIVRLSAKYNLSKA